MSGKGQPGKPLAEATVINVKKVASAPKPFVPRSSRKPFGGTSIPTSAPKLPQKRSVASLFADDDDEVEVEAPPKKNLIRLLDAEQGASPAESVPTNEPTQEIDPLEAFMSGIEKEPVPQNANKGKRNLEDDLPTFMEQRPADAPGGANADERFYEDYDSGDENYLDSMREENMKDKKFIEPLPVVYHSEIEYAPFTKKFNVPLMEHQKMSPAEIHAFRKKIDIRVVGENIPQPARTFQELGLGERIMKSIEKQGFQEPTPIQSQAIPVALSGRDVIGIAETGSGKTASFLWPMLIHIRAQPALQKGDGPLGIVVAPTRELAQQIYLEARKYAKPFRLNVCPIYGGIPKTEQIKELKKGCEILVCTPGRLIDIIKMKKITNMRRVTYLVFDEADKMFNMGFEIQVRSIAGQIRPDRQSELMAT